MRVVSTKEVRSVIKSATASVYEEVYEKLEILKVGEALEIYFDEVPEAHALVPKINNLIRFKNRKMHFRQRKITLLRGNTDRIEKMLIIRHS